MNILNVGAAGFNLGGKMAKVVAVLVCLIAVGFGVIRVGVGLLLMAQASGLMDVAAFNEPITDIQRFLQEKNDQALLPLTPVSYLAVIAFMGFCLLIGAVGAWQKRIWGYAVLGLYLLTHASLFVNFQTINPKINILIIGVVMLLVLIFANRFRR